MSFRLCVALARTDESILNPNYGQHQQQQQLPTPPTTSSSSTTSAQRRFNNDIDSDDEDDEIDIGVVASSATSPQLTVISRADSDAKIAAARAKVLRRHQTLFDAIDNENNIDAFHLLLKEMLTQV